VILQIKRKGNKKKKKKWKQLKRREICKYWEILIVLGICEWIVVDYKLANIVVLFLLVVYFTEERDKIPNNTQRLLVHGGFKLLQYTAAAAAALQFATPFLTLESETSNSCLPRALISFQCHFTSDLFHTQTRPPSLPHTTHSVTFLGFVLDFALCVSCCLLVVIYSASTIPIPIP